MKRKGILTDQEDKFSDQHKVKTHIILYYKISYDPLPRTIIFLHNTQNICEEETDILHTK